MFPFLILNLPSHPFRPQSLSSLSFSPPFPLPPLSIVADEVDDSIHGRRNLLSFILVFSLPLLAVSSASFAGHCDICSALPLLTTLLELFASCRNRRSRYSPLSLSLLATSSTLFVVAVLGEEAMAATNSKRLSLARPKIVEEAMASFSSLSPRAGGYGGNGHNYDGCGVLSLLSFSLTSPPSDLDDVSSPILSKS